MFETVLLDGGIMQILTARRILGRDLYRAAAYHVDGLLVDTGIARKERSILRALEDLPVRMIVNTHSHEDHIGANGLLQSVRGVPVFAHLRALPALADPRLLALLPYQKFLFGTPRPSHGTAVPGTLSTDRHVFRILELPGHSPDQIGLFEEKEGWLFCGDAYIGGKDSVLRKDYDLRGMIGTLRILSRLPMTAMFTGVGSVVKDPIRRIERKLAALMEAEEKVRALKSRGLPEKEIARRLFPGDLAVRIVTTGHFSSLHLVRSYLAETRE
jgi:glyoxylase-like metal-dependent hydrolase (beta-lactamase superfamily II)